MKKYVVVMKRSDTDVITEYRQWCFTRRGAYNLAAKINKRRIKNSGEEAVFLGPNELDGVSQFGALSDNFANMF